MGPQSSAWSTPSQAKSVQFAPRPFAGQMQQAPPTSPTSEESENEAFDQNKLETFALQLKEISGTITPMDQERLSVLQTKMNDFWAQRQERAARLGHHFANISVHAPGKLGAAPVQVQLAIQRYRAGGLSQSLRRVGSHFLQRQQKLPTFTPDNHEASPVTGQPFRAVTLQRQAAPERDAPTGATGTPPAQSNEDAYFSWYETPPQQAINPASTIFSGALNQVGQTYPVLNGQRTWRDTDSAIDQMAHALNGPVFERMGSRIRIVEPRRNSASALMLVPGAGPWRAEVNVGLVRAFAASDSLSSAVLREIVTSLPNSGTISINIRANSRFTANTLAHERQHADDIRHACEMYIREWNYAITSLAGRWFESEAEMDNELFRHAELVDAGDRLHRLAAKIFFSVGHGANYLHLVGDTHHPLIAQPIWLASQRTLEFSLVEQ